MGNNNSKESLIQRDWTWNDRYDRYEATYETTIIDFNVYEYGEVIASLFLSEKTSSGSFEEVIKFLPFSRSFVEEIKDVNGIIIEHLYTEMFGFDYQYINDKGYITFYIENSDKEAKPDYIEDEYTFKISSILDPENVPNK